MLRLLFLFGFRNLKKQKLYTTINLVGLALGFFSFLAIWIYVDQEKSFDEFHSKKKRIYRLISTNPQRVAAIVPYAWGAPMKAEIPAVENVASFQNITIALTVKKEGEVFGQKGFIGADSTFLDIFDFPVVRGGKKHYLRDPNKMLLTQEMADKYFPEMDPIGQSLQVNLWGNWVTYEVEGIVECPRNSHIQFQFIIPIELVRKHFFSQTAFTSWTTHFIYTYMVLAEDVDKAQLKKDFLNLLVRHGGEELRNRNTPGVISLEDIYLKSNVQFDFPPRGDQRSLNILMAVAIGVLFMGVINFVNISSAQALRRRKEASLRKVMGSDKKALILQFAVESNFISLMAMFLAMALLLSILPYFNSLTGYTLGPSDVFNISYLLPAVITAFTVGSLSSIYPAIIMSSFRPVEILSGRSVNNVKGLSRKILVVIQFTLAITLLIATGMIYRQVRYMQDKDLGFTKEQIIVMDNARNIATSAAKTDLLRQELLKHEGFEVVSAASTYPGDEHWSNRFVPDGYGPDEGISITTIYSDHDFANTYDLEFVIGRDFDRAVFSDSTGFLINESAMALFSNRDMSWVSDPIGKELASGNEKGEVLGVLKDFHFSSLKEEINPLVIQIDPGSFFSIQVKMETRNIAENLQILESSWKRLFPEAPFSYSFLDQEFAILFKTEESLGSIIRVFAVLAIMVAVLGLFGLASFLAFHKAREMSIRKIIGASEYQLTSLLSWHFLKLILIANALAIPVAYFLMNQWLDGFAYRTNLSGLIFLGAIALSFVVAGLTVGRQSYKTATLNPVDVLNKN